MASQRQLHEARKVSRVQQVHVGRQENRADMDVMVSVVACSFLPLGIHVFETRYSLACSTDY